VDTLFHTLKTSDYIIVDTAPVNSRGYVVDSETCGYFYLCGSTTFGKKHAVLPIACIKNKITKHVSAS
jgi:hypothetical protein